MNLQKITYVSFFMKFVEKREYIFLKKKALPENPLYGKKAKKGIGG
ncbi:hypothetical protein [Bacillus massilinigeriensis]|nr:hypothetical protein [Bacillus massilionigeriensis]